MGMATQEIVAAVARKATVPVINTYADQLLPPFPQIGLKNYQAGKVAAEYFVRKGFRSFIAVETPYSENRCRGFQEAFLSLGLNAPLFSLRASLKDEDRRTAIKKLIQLLRPMSKPVALYCEHDLLAVTIVSALQEYGIHVPNDVAVLSTQNDELVCKSTIPHISSINLPYEEIGYEAARVMDIILRGGTPPAEPIQLDPLGVTERQSTEIMAVPDPNIQKAITYIKQNACGPIKVAEIARASGLSLRVLQNHFKTALGYSLQKEIRHIRIARAKELLETTGLPLIEVAEKIGYTDKSHLIAAFRTSTGMTPGNYRKQFKT